MIIDSQNGQIINSREIYIHDDILENMVFHRNKKVLKLFLTKNWPTECEYSIDFFQVIGFEMSSCDFWGASPHILDYEYMENGTLIPELFSKKDDDSFCPLKNEDDYMETVMTFASGDTLRIACEKVIINAAPDVLAVPTTAPGTSSL